jgi:hypothetical protein
MLPQNDKYKSLDYSFLRAEALCAELLGNGFSFGDLIVSHSGSFRKSYRHDIEGVNLNDEEGSDKSVLEIMLNRDGIYDRLPEGLFHQTRGSSNTKGLSQMVEEHKRYKDEEKQARKFFHPLDQEFFRYAVLVEQEERALQAGMVQGGMDSTFSKFWGLPQGLPAEPASKLTRVMSWLHRIKGDLELSTRALEMMLGLQVKSRQFYAQEQRMEDTAFRLGECELGVDTVAGALFAEPSLCWEFSILDIPDREIASYTDDMPHARFLRHFTEVFIPIEIDAIFVYELETVKDQPKETILGYGFRI